MLLNNCSDVLFDHCRIRSGSRAISLNVDNAKPLDENRDIEIGNCLIDWGLPKWFFRSDRKDHYRFSLSTASKVTTEQTQEDKLGYSTSGVQISGKSRCFNVEIHHREIFNAHDSYVFGNGMRFHHNWVHNLNDDGIAVSVEADTKNCHIFCNVMTQCLTALSFAAKRAAGVVYIYANLFDIRESTLGVRPPAAGVVADALRKGHFFKDGRDEGEIHLFHNTCVVLDPGAKGTDFGDANDAGYYPPSASGRSLAPPLINNIFVAAFTPGKVKPVAFLAPGTSARPTATPSSASPRPTPHTTSWPDGDTGSPLRSTGTGPSPI